MKLITFTLCVSLFSTSLIFSFINFLLVVLVFRNRRFFFIKKLLTKSSVLANLFFFLNLIPLHTADMSNTRTINSTARILNSKLQFLTMKCKVMWKSNLKIFTFCCCFVYYFFIMSSKFEYFLIFNFFFFFSWKSCHLISI